MKLPFTVEEFLNVFKQYNTSVFPAQLLFVLTAVCAIYFLFREKNSSGKVICFILSALWLWMGAVYHLIFFSVINPLAYGFGGLFLVEGVLLFVYAFRLPSFSFKRSLFTISGCILLIYALIIYPLVGSFTDHSYPYSPTFGVPCPTTIFTIAIFLLADKRIPFYLIFIPILWTAIGFSAAFILGIYEDAMLIVSGLVLVFLNFKKPKRYLT